MTNTMSEQVKKAVRRKRQRWFVRDGDGNVYGPADMQTLKAWCLDGRIEPDNELSHDQKTWVSAPSVPELEMNWYARMDDGTLIGPFPLELIPGLLENEIFGETTLLEHRITGETRLAGVDVEPSATEVATVHPSIEMSGTPLPEIIADGLPEDSEVENPETTDPESESPEPDSPEAEASNEVESEALEELEPDASDPHAEAPPQQEDLRQMLQQLRAERAALQDDTRRLQEELAVVQDTFRQSETQLFEQQNYVVEAETEIENLRLQLEQMKSGNDRLQHENQRQLEKLDTLRDELLKNEQNYKQELEEWHRRTDAKTELLAGTVQTLLSDGDLARRLKSTPPTATDAAGNEGDTAQLKQAFRRLEQQLTYERDQAEHQIARLTSQKPRSALMSFGLLLLIILSSGALLIILLAGVRGCRRGGGGPMAGTQGRAAVGSASNFSDAVDGQEGLPADATLDLQPETTLLPDEQPVQRVTPAAAVPVWPEIALPRASITQTARALRIVFNEGLFSAGTRLSPEAEEDLASLAEQIRGQLNGHQLMIEGHTDATPVMTGGSRYVDNFALGMARAEAVKTFLAGTGRLPAEAMRTVSAGDSSPPFSNETEAGRMRNRTAVITLVAR